MSEEMPNAEEYEQQARLLMDEGKYNEALRETSDGFRADASYMPLYHLAVACLREMGGDEERALFENVLENPKEAQGYYKIGAHFITYSDYDLGLPFIEKAFKMDPDNEYYAYDLSVCYGSRFDIQKAYDTLVRFDDSEDIAVRIRLAYLNILLGQTEGVGEELMKLAKEIPPSVDNYSSVLEVLKVDHMNMRQDALENPQVDIMDWHFIQYGGVLLNIFGESDEEFEVAGGRFVALWLSMEQVQRTLANLLVLLKDLDKVPENLFYIDDRDSEILARALGQMLNLYPVPVEEKHTDIKKSLIVAAEADSFQTEEYFFLKFQQEDQVLFAFNQNWLQDLSICPDITGFLTQSIGLPWQGGELKMDTDEDGEVVSSPTDDRKPEVIAQELVVEEYEIDEEFEELLGFYTDFSEFLKINHAQIKTRFEFAVESPVPGSYFH